LRYNFFYYLFIYFLFIYLFSGTAAKSGAASLPIARRRNDDDDLESLLSESKVTEHKKIDAGKVAPWLA
jgi:hypothetical protein